MSKIDCLVSRKNITRWLENYNELKAGGRIEREVAISGGGDKARDGISGAMIDMIMLDKGIDCLRKDHEVLYNCVYYRWIQCLRWKEVQPFLNMARSTYYKYCEQAVDYLYYQVNGNAGGMADLLASISKGSSTLKVTSQQKRVLRR